VPSFECVPAVWLTWVHGGPRMMPLPCDPPCELHALSLHYLVYIFCGPSLVRTQPYHEAGVTARAVPSADVHGHVLQNLQLHAHLLRCRIDHVGWPWAPCTAVTLWCRKHMLCRLVLSVLNPLVATFSRLWCKYMLPA